MTILEPAAHNHAIALAQCFACRVKRQSGANHHGEFSQRGFELIVASPALGPVAVTSRLASGSAEAELPPPCRGLRA